MTLKELNKQASFFPDTDPMPVVFVGHGSPMNAVEDNEFTKEWKHVESLLPLPKAIVCISAHWETRGTFVMANELPKTIHDFYGFPAELYDINYPASGSPLLADKIIEEIKNPIIENALDWGLDHGAWTVLRHIYPNADIPVIQISIDHFKDVKWHYELGKQLAFLRRKGVLVVGSGNMVHNLRMIGLIDDDFNAEYGYDWAFELNTIFKDKIKNAEDLDLINYSRLHKDVRYAIPTLEHYIPLIYILGMRNDKDEIRFFNDKVITGSLSMTSVIIGN
mgnify:CR=1 FL=1